MRDEPTWEKIAFWVVFALVGGLFVWLNAHATSGTEDFADSPPSLAPSTAIQAPSSSPVSEMQAPTPSPASPSLSPSPSVILPPTFGARDRSRAVAACNRLTVYILSHWFVP
jgi:hypothetical protein